MHLVWFNPPCEILISVYRNWSDEISRRKQDQAQTSACEVVFYNFNVPLEQVWLFDQLWITNVVMSVAIKLMNHDKYLSIDGAKNVISLYIPSKNSYSSTPCL